MVLDKNKKNNSAYITELEDSIVDLSLRLKSKNIELSSYEKNSRILFGKLLHNLKNPVGVIYSFSEMILEYSKEPAPGKLEKHVDIINKSAAFSLKLLDSFSEYFNLFTSNTPFKYKPVNYIGFINTIVAQFNDLIEDKKVKIEMVVPKENVMLKIDSIRMTKAISNIITNGIRYSNDKATIKIVIREKQDTIETEITDNGIGISESDLPHIFDEFFVVNTYSKDKEKCIGLGLAISNKIIDEHRGKIKIKSALGKGSSFTISLPKAEDISI